MEYTEIIKEIEPRVHVRVNENVCEVEDALQQLMDCILTGNVCPVPHQETNVSIFMKMVHQKHPYEYTKKVIQWIEHVVPHWRECTPVHLHTLLDEWILGVTREYQVSYASLF